MSGTVRSLASAIRRPIAPATRARLAAVWAALPAALRTPNQFLGRQYAGCGATIGVMPRCDFACRGCYLGAGANEVPPRPVEEIEHQLRVLREWLGHGGNLQITDGEATLRDEDELIAIVRAARRIGLVPMLMTHGDSFRRRPHLLPRLVREAGLSEISVHVDVTQRGRTGAAYKHAARESQLEPLRDELAAIVRDVRRRTGKPLDAATTMTVTRDNATDVADVVRWMCRNADAFKMISFQPAAQVGRTGAGVGGRVSVDELWQSIAEGLLGRSGAAHELARSEGWLGHPACSRFVQGAVVRESDGEPRFHSLFRRDDALEQRVLARLVAELGGLTFRLDDRLQAIARALGVLLRAPSLCAHDVPRLIAHWARRFAPGDPLGLAWRWLRGETRIDYLNVVSHHFMSAVELASPLGRERVAACAFRVPIGEELVSMCEVNALGVRDRYYAAGDPRAVRPSERPAAEMAGAGAAASSSRELPDRLHLVREHHQTLPAVELDGDQAAPEVLAQRVDGPFAGATEHATRVGDRSDRAAAASWRE